MLTNSRQVEMEEFIKLNKNVTVQQLIEQFNVSDMTIRRDLVQLEKTGIVKRVHGGAIYSQVGKEVAISVRELTHQTLKERIAVKAATFIKDGDVILLDGGTTTFAVAQKLTSRNHLTVITNALNIATFFSNYPHISVVMPGGDVLHTTQSLVGPATTRFFETLRVDKAFIGSGGVSVERGLLNANMIEGEVKKVMLQIAQEKYIVADHTKFKNNGFYIYAPIDEVDFIITTDELKSEIKNELSRLSKPQFIFV